MTVSDLRVLVNNLDEYIHVPGGIERLKKTVLHLAVSGQLTSQIPGEGTGEELYQKIQAEKAKSAKKTKPLPKIDHDEAPYDIPSNWKWVRLGDITNYGSADKSKPQAISPTTWVLELEDIEKGTSKLLQKVLASSRPSLSDKNIFYAGDVLYGKLRPYLDKVLVADDDGVCSSEVLPIRSYGGNIHPHYRRLVMKSPDFIKTVSDITYGVKMPRLGTEDGRKMLLALPPLDEQKRIVEKVYDIFGLIDELTTKYKTEEFERGRFVKCSLRELSHGKSLLALENLQVIKTKSDATELRKAILHLAVSGQLVPQVPSEGTGEAYFKQIQAKLATNLKRKSLPEVRGKEMPFEIPEGWRWTRLGDLFDITSSKRVMQSDWKSSGVPFLRARDLTNAIKTGRIESNIFVSESYFNETSQASGVPKPGDIMVSGVGTIGTPYTVKEGDRFYFKDATILWFRNPAGVFVDYVEMIFHTAFMKAVIMGQSQGTTVNTYTIANARLNMIPLPPLLEQKRIVKKTYELLDLVSELEKHL